MPLTSTASGNLTFNNQTVAAYTLQTTDAGNAVTMNNAAANTLTVPPASQAAIAIGAPIVIQQLGAGQTSIAAGAGVTIRTASTLNARAQYSVLTLVQESINNWTLTGDFA
jgi:hypothetical protein